MRKVREISDKTREGRVRDFVGRWKFLNNPKFSKTNNVSVAAFGSWAERGQAGGCGLCNAKHYIYTIRNKRYTTLSQRSKGKMWYWQQIGCYLCEVCFVEVEKKVGYSFNKSYAR